ncbi:hypothetical protein L195_g038916, partial [Trifolium pratense]
MYGGMAEMTETPCEGDGGKEENVIDQLVFRACVR